MKIKVEPNQTIYDIAVQYYGTCEAIGEIARLNPILINEFRGQSPLLDTSLFYLDLPLKVGSEIKIDENSELHNRNITKQLTSPITTYQIWPEQ